MNLCFFSLSVDLGCRKQTGKWSETSVLNIIVLKLVFTNQFLKTWFIIVDVFLVTLVGFFIAGIKLFW